jgi:hypothetical protein
LCNQKLSHVVMLKLLSQKAELDARREIIQEGIFKDEESLYQTLTGNTNGLLGDQSSLSEFGMTIVIRSLQTETEAVADNIPRMVHLLKSVAGKYLSTASHSLLSKKIDENFSTSTSSSSTAATSGTADHMGMVLSLFFNNNNHHN